MQVIGVQSISISWKGDSIVSKIIFQHLSFILSFNFYGAIFQSILTLNIYFSRTLLEKESRIEKLYDFYAPKCAAGSMPKMV